MKCVVDGYTTYRYNFFLFYKLQGTSTWYRTRMNEISISDDQTSKSNVTPVSLLHVSQTNLVSGELFASCCSRRFTKYPPLFRGSVNLSFVTNSNWSFASYTCMPHGPHPASNIFVFTVPGSHVNIVLPRIVLFFIILKYISKLRLFMHVFECEYDQWSLHCLSNVKSSNWTPLVCEIDATFNIRQSSESNASLFHSKQFNMYGANTFVWKVNFFSRLIFSLEETLPRFVPQCPTFCSLCRPRLSSLDRTSARRLLKSSNRSKSRQPLFLHHPFR